MNAVDIINKKKRGLSLTQEEIQYMINDYVKNIIPDYQMSAFLMTIYFQGLSNEETTFLTEAMINSGETVDLSFIQDTVVDKHSTGGVGDKVSLISAPIVASLGVPVAKMSGRGLGHTGGTIDKLESIHGFNTELSDNQFKNNVEQNGIALVGQNKNLVPADKMLYALRDVTGTVDSIPLLASSIMSKKIASGADAIVLDVKLGNGAFMKTVSDAERLAETMVSIGNRMNRKTIAILTNMNQPLGYEVGNMNEVQEAIRVLKGEETDSDIYDVSVEISSYMVLLAGLANDISEAKELVKNNINNGKAYEKFVEFIQIQGGSIKSVDSISVKNNIIINSDRSGYIANIDTESVGRAVLLLGAGRLSKGDKIDHNVGITIKIKLNDKIQSGDEMFIIHSNHSNNDEIVEILKRSVTISDKTIDQPLPTIIKVIS